MITSHQQLLSKFGIRSLTDISNVPEMKSMAAAQPLPPHFRQRDYQFRDPDLGRGMMDAAFYKKELVNARVQLFFDGWFGGSKARKYLHQVLIPLFSGVLGDPKEKSRDYDIFHANGIIVQVRYVPGTASVSSHLTDERFEIGRFARKR